MTPPDTKMDRTGFRNMTIQSSTVLNLGAAATIFLTVLTFSVVQIREASKEADRFSDNLQAAIVRFDTALKSVSSENRKTHGAVMEIGGQLMGIAASLASGAADRRQLHEQLDRLKETERQQDLRIRELERVR